ncbi:MAG: hypothetical protein GWO08_23025, partial [Gammaproteobacteria bacterium]|nr:hypothetical protein [Gammaproteobacteria bacterium]
MPVWTDAPRHLTVSCPAEVPAGNSTCQVTVTDLNAPVQGAMVCLMQDTVVYETALTGLDGQVSLDVAPTNPAHPMYLTVTAKNFVPYQDTLTVMTNQPYVHIDGYATNGSPDGLITPGETINVDVTVKNYGSMRAQNVWMILRSASAKITMIDSVVSAGDILPGNQLVMTDAFSFQAGSALVNGEVIHLSATISDTQGTIWTDLVSVTGATPVIACYHHQVSDSLYGDGDGFIEPGERITLRLIAENSGLLAARQTSATLTTSDPNVTISNPNLSYGNITPSTQRLQSTELEIGASCPAPSFPQINLQFQTSDGYQFADSIYVPVG